MEYIEILKYIVIAYIEILKYIYNGIYWNSQ